MDNAELIKKLLKYFSSLEQKGELPLSLEGFESRIWTDFPGLTAHQILPVVGSAIALGMLKGSYHSHPQEGTFCTVEAVTPEGHGYLQGASNQPSRKT